MKKLFMLFMGLLISIVFISQAQANVFIDKNMPKNFGPHEVGEISWVHFNFRHKNVTLGIKSGEQFVYMIFNDADLETGKALVNAVGKKIDFNFQLTDNVVTELYIRS